MIRGTRQYSLPLLPLGPGGVCKLPLHGVRRPYGARPRSGETNGGGGIRTHGTVARTRRFQRRSFGHSDTPPQAEMNVTEGGGLEPPSAFARRFSKPVPYQLDYPSA